MFVLLLFAVLVFGFKKLQLYSSVSEYDFHASLRLR